MGKYLDLLKVSVSSRGQNGNLENLNNQEKTSILGFLGPSNASFDNLAEHRSQSFEYARLISSDNLAINIDQSALKAPALAYPETNSENVNSTAALTEDEIVLNPWSHWSEAEVISAQRRSRSFTLKGLDPIEAEDLACSLVGRDRTGDDRRTCYECQHFHRGCRQGLSPIGGVLLTLHRCILFKENCYE